MNESVRTVSVHKIRGEEYCRANLNVALRIIAYLEETEISGNRKEMLHEAAYEMKKVSDYQKELSE